MFRDRLPIDDLRPVIDAFDSSRVVHAGDDVLAVANEPRCSVPQVINGLPSVIGCTDCGSPGQWALAPARAQQVGLDAQ